MIPQRARVRQYKVPMGIEKSVLWLDAFDDDALSLRPATNFISGMDDKSGNNNNAVQAVEAEQPTYVANGLNGRPTIRWAHAGAAMGLEIAGGVAIGANVPRTLFMVLNPASGFGNSEAFGRNTGQRIDFAADRLNVRDDTRNPVSAAGTVPQNTPNIITVSNATELGADLNAFNGSTQIMTNLISAFGWDMAVPIGIGESIGFGSRSYHGDISEIILILGVLEDKLRLDYLAYLTTKWGF